jgi:uncharacterized protein YhbP (UPF0306 family)
MNKSIIQFLKDQTCASICCTDEQGKPYCFSCFYAFHEEEGLLYFKSSPNSHHSALMKKNQFVAGTVLPDKLNKLIVKGIQFEGIVLDSQHPLMKTAASRYFTQNPLALAIPGEIWAIRIDQIKMTDNTLGFGKKITWHRTERPEEIASV